MSAKKPRKGVLLLNLGTPEAPTPQAVRKYLKEFLMDPYVLDIPFLLRWVLVHGRILPTRSKSSAAAYQKIWTERGSPLLRILLRNGTLGVDGGSTPVSPLLRILLRNGTLGADGGSTPVSPLLRILLRNGTLGADGGSTPVSPLLLHHLELTEKVRIEMQRDLDVDWFVQPGMRYGEPSLRQAFCEFKAQGIRDVVIFPLYPQYSLAATESSIQECLRLAGQIERSIRIRVVRSFYSDEGFIRAFAHVAEEALESFKPFAPDYYLFSFHGLPERQIKKLDTTQTCLSHSRCCEEIGDASLVRSPDCYRAQCFVTARLIAREMGLTPDEYTVSFQSRLGRTPWIRPFTDELYRDLPKRGVRRVAVLCPSFVADCLETLEEVQIRGRQDFIQAGGEDLRLIPSLNASEPWVQTVARIARNS